MSNKQLRHEDVLSAALEVFGQYGYAKATMEDIARRAGVSRATLYLWFATKEDLARAGARTVLARALERATAVASSDMGPMARVEGAMTAYIGTLLEQVGSGPHARDIMDATSPVVAEVVRHADEELHDILVGTVDEAVAAGTADLSQIGADPAGLVDFLLSTAQALRRNTPDPDVWRERRSMFFRVVGAAIETGDVAGARPDEQEGER